MTIPSTGKTCAVVVTHQPDVSRLREGLEALRAQVEQILIVDNGSVPSARDRLQALADATTRFLPLGENRGPAAAHNRGIEWAAAQGFGYVLLLDQDSVPAPGMVATLLDAHAALVSSGTRVAAVGPRYVDPSSGHSSFFVRFGPFGLRRMRPETLPERIIPVDFLISSGSLISLATVEQVGIMDESLFIDHVDTEWLLRARARGYRAYGVRDAVMAHCLGDDTFNLWLGRWRHLPLHSPLRHYYIFRNSVLLYKRRYAPLQWVVNDLLRLIGMFVFYSLAAPPRLRQARMMLRGLVDGIQGRTGRL
ncbi:MAG: glycosyltransferase family 2 protein [Betaproteobacteria bacterium]|nr:glycosyltransferase family 2 protein [Betaproteobacteria bacterium]